MINDQANGIRAIKEQALLPKEKKKYVIPRISERKKKQILEDSELAKENEALEKWYNDRRKELVGICCNCKGQSNKYNTERWKWSVAHIIKKSLFNSVSTHPYNFIELCVNCHKTFDNSYETAQKMYCWSEAKRKFEFFKKSITEKHKDLNWFD